MKLTAKVKDWIRQTILEGREWNYNKIADMLAAELEKLVGEKRNENLFFDCTNDGFVSIFDYLW